MRAKLPVNTPQNHQEVIEVDQSGAYFDKARVLWDEREDGPLDPAILSKLGGLARNGKTLEVDAVKLEAYQAVVRAEADAKTQAETEIAVAKAAVKSFDLDGKPTTEDLESAVKALVRLARGA